MIKKLFNNLINSINGLKIVIKESSFILELVLGFFLIPYIFLSNILIILLFFGSINLHKFISLDLIFWIALLIAISLDAISINFLLFIFVLI